MKIPVHLQGRQVRKTEGTDMGDRWGKSLMQVVSPSVWTPIFVGPEAYMM
jgi:hypothetical protein